MEAARPRWPRPWRGPSADERGRLAVSPRAGAPGCRAATARESRATTARPPRRCPRRPAAPSPPAPARAAVAPDSNSPSWLLAPMNTELTALTRPRMSSGVSSCTRVWRMTTLIMSAAPPAASIGHRQPERGGQPEDDAWSSRRRPRPTAGSARCGRRIGQRTSASDITSAPTAGAPRSRPRPARGRRAARPWQTSAAARWRHPAAPQTGPARWRPAPPCG